MKIQANEGTEAKEVLIKNKKWFNGAKTFTTVKMSPPQEQPTELKINVGDTLHLFDRTG